MSGFLRLHRIAGAYRQAFATPEGRIVLKDMIRVVGLYRESGARDPGLLQYQEGARDVVRRLLKLTKLSEDELERMMEEAVDE